LTTEREKTVASILDLLALVPAGKATVTVGGHPVLSVDADKKTLVVEADGVGEAGLHLSDLVKLQEGTANMLKGSIHVTGALSRLGWNLTLCAEGEKVLSMGKGAPRLTGRISLNPLGLRKLMKALK
jgi:hypothetical protein